MTRMADPERPRDENDFDDERFEDEGRRSIFSALWFRAILVVIVLGVVAAVAVPYVLEVANQPVPKMAALAKPEITPLAAPPPAAVTPPAPPVASVPPAPAPAPEKTSAADKPAAMDKPATSDSSSSAPMAPATDKPVAAPEKSEPSKSAVASTGPSSSVKDSTAARASRASAPSPAGPGEYFVQVGAFKNPDTAKKVAARLREQKYNVEETSANGVKTARAAAPSAPAPSTGPSDRYDVYVSGAAPADINTKLSTKGLSA